MVNEPLHRNSFAQSQPLLESNLFSPQANWQQLEFLISPPPRNESAIVLNPINSIVLLFGGISSSGDEFNDLWITNGLQWIKFLTPHSPEKRSGASMAYDEVMQSVVLFGGASNMALLGDTWLFNGTDWVRQQPPTSPSPRVGAHMAYDTDQGITVLFGGQVDTGQKFLEPSNETWTWNGTNWQKLSLDNAPSARWGARMVYDSAHKSILLFGGAAGGEFYDDTWLWNGTSWTELHPLQHPAGRANFGMTFDENRQQVILFGGQSFAYVDITETWAWDGQDWNKLEAIQTPPEELAYGAQLAYMPILNTVMLYNSFRPKPNPVDINFSSFWILNYRYLAYAPFIRK